MIESISIVFIGFSGFILALYLNHKKREQHESFVCPLKADCAQVIRSDYATFFGVSVERLGIAYYAFIAIGHGLFLIFPQELAWLDPYLLLASASAFFFSLYLTFIQLIVLRKLCSWCLLSAAFCLVIFVLTIVGMLDMVLPFLIDYHSIILIFHIMFVALGLGAATLTDVFFLKFLKDFRISEHEADVLSTLSQFIWFALCFIIITGFALFLPEAAYLQESPKFLAKMIVVAVIIVNGAFLNLYVAPRLVKISFGERHRHREGELSRARRLAFALGSISIVSWYSAFILGSLPSTIPLSFFTFLKLYVLLLAIGVTIGQFAENRISHRGVPWPVD